VIPTVETSRLRLREWRESDFEAYAAFRADPDACHHIGVLSRGDAWRAMAFCAGHWNLLGFGFWSLELKSTGENVGYCGPYFPKEWPEPEIGWGIFRPHQGRGYATEAAARSLLYAYDILGWKTAISLVANSNAASIAVAERLGAKPEAPYEYRGETCTIYRHLNHKDFELHSKEKMKWPLS
jgi:RimJ/RimL family protein N-acetyltransferase